MTQLLGLIPLLISGLALLVLLLAFLFGVGLTFWMIGKALMRALGERI